MKEIDGQELATYLAW